MSVYRINLVEARTNVVDFVGDKQYNEYVCQNDRKKGSMMIQHNKFFKRFVTKTAGILALLVLVSMSMTACSSGEEISIEIPALYTYDMSEGQVKSQAEEIGCKKYEIHEDGSVSYLFSESGQNKAVELLEEKMVKSDKVRAEVYGDAAELTVNQDRTRYTLYSDASEGSFDHFYRLEALSYLYEGAYYQLVSGAPIGNVEVTVTIIDAATNEVLDNGCFSSWYAWINSNPGTDPFSEDATNAAFSQSGGDLPNDVSSDNTEEIETPPPAVSQYDNIQLNQPFSVGDIMEITLNSHEWNDQVLPSDTTGGYTFFEGEDGETYFIVHGTLKSPAGSSFDIDNCSEATITINDKYTFNARMKLEANDHTGFNASVKPLQTLNLVIFSSISDEVMAIAESVQVSFDIVTEEEALKYYYDDKYPHENYTITFMNDEEPTGGDNADTDATLALCELGKEYQEENGLYVTLNSFTVTEEEGYNSVRISYTVQNKTPDTKVLPGSFKLFFTDDTGEPQYGGFDYLFYGESDEREYEWKLLKSQEILVLEYNANDDDEGLDGAFFRNQPIDGALHWLP